MDLDNYEKSSDASVKFNIKVSLSDDRQADAPSDVMFHDYSDFDDLGELDESSDAPVESSDCNSPESSIATSDNEISQLGIVPETDPTSEQTDDWFNSEKIIPFPIEKIFKNAFANANMPDIVCGVHYEYVLVPGDHYASFELFSVEVLNRTDFKAELNAERKMIRIKGTAQSTGELRIKLEYKYIDPNRTNNDQNKIFEAEKVLIIKPDPIAKSFDELNTEFIRLCRLNPLSGVAGDFFSSCFKFSKYLIKFQDRLKLLERTVEPQCGIETKLEENGDIKLEGIPSQEGEFSLNLRCELETLSGSKEETMKFPFIKISPDPRIVAWENFSTEWCDNLVSERVVCGESIEKIIIIPESFQPDYMRIKECKLLDSDLEPNLNPNLDVTYDKADAIIIISGIPSVPYRKLVLQVQAEVDTKIKGTVHKSLDLLVLETLPDPKTLWKNLPTDPNAPYPCENDDKKFIQAGERVIVAASKRGRSHAHDGRFRDDNFKVDYFPETGWYIIAVSDGAGSAKYSREGSRIACQTFWNLMHDKLASAEVNAKLDAMDSTARENALRSLILNATYQGLLEIDAEATRFKATRRDYNATFLAYVMKRYGDSWLIVSIGIGDGIIGVLKPDGALELLTEPDGGEFVGQTRFITMNEVWKDNPQNRTRSTKVDNFEVIMSMSDGVSDPKFETDSNLSDPQLWKNLWDELRKQIQVPEPSEETAERLNQWLDFWSKGNHDDRTIVLVF